eukprot:380947-Prymnesium_polylepis.1
MQSKHLPLCTPGQERRLDLRALSIDVKVVRRAVLAAHRAVYTQSPQRGGGRDVARRRERAPHEPLNGAAAHATGKPADRRRCIEALALGGGGKQPSVRRVVVGDCGDQPVALVHEVHELRVSDVGVRLVTSGHDNYCTAVGFLVLATRGVVLPPPLVDAQSVESLEHEEQLVKLGPLDVSKSNVPLLGIGVEVHARQLDLD